MITHNGKYLLHATHHGMPIYAATMGGKMVIDGWLLPLTLQAIVDAFGSAEGTEVIRKTNDYLNRIATTDPQRALLLANFINEDPMLVCSLVETSKMRWLVNNADGNYIVTPFLPDYGITYGATVIQHRAEATKEYSVFGSRTTQSSSFLLQIMDGKWRSQCFGGWLTYGTVKLNVAYNVEFNFKGIKVDGTQIVSGDYKPSPAITDSIWLVVNNNANAPHGSYFIGGYADFYRKDENGEITNRLVPFRRNGQMELLDILTGNLATRVGTFTEQLTPKTTS